MTYVINELCIGVKDISCVEVCPVDCIHPAYYRKLRALTPPT